LEVPVQVPLTVSFNSRHQVGVAICKLRDDRTVIVTAEIEPKAVARLFGCGLAGSENMQSLYPFLGVQSVHAGGVERPGIVTQVAVIGRNADDGVPRYRMTVELRDAVLARSQINSPR
jgi:hypothetical protein